MHALEQLPGVPQNSILEEGRLSSPRICRERFRGSVPRQFRMESGVLSLVSGAPPWRFWESRYRWKVGTWCLLDAEGVTGGETPGSEDVAARLGNRSRRRTKTCGHSVRIVRLPVAARAIGREAGSVELEALRWRRAAPLK